MSDDWLSQSHGIDKFPHRSLTSESDEESESLSDATATVRSPRLDEVSERLLALLRFREISCAREVAAL